MFRFKFLFFIFSLFFVFGCSDAYLDLLGIGDNSSGNNGNSGDNVSYTVSFNSNGGTGEMKSVTVSSGKYKLPLNTYYYEGFNFTGWSNSSDGELLYGDGEEIEVSSNITLYALWQEESSSGIETYYTITFDSNGGQGSMESQSVLQGKRVQISFNSFLKDGYTFTGWSTENNNIPVYTNGDYITVDRDITLYACWKEDTVSAVTYTVYFNSNNGDGYMPPLKVNEGETFELTSNIFTRAGFSFEGWSLTQNGEVAYKDGASLSINNDIELFAVWKAVSFFTITFHSNNDSNETKTVSFPSNVMPVKLPDNTFQNGTKKFTGWKTSDNSVIYTDGSDVVYLTGNIDLYASWSDNPVTITFDALGGKGEMPDIYAMPGDVIKLPKASFTKVGYELKETYTYDIYTYGFGSDFKVPSSDVILYANWLKLPEPEVPTFGGNSKKYRNEYVFVNGVKMLESDWIESSSKGIYYGIWKDYAGWYDVYQGSFNLCWAASSSNIIHWWYDRNKANIEKYYTYYAPEDIVKPDFVYHGKGKSDIFDLYKEKWRDGGWYVDNGLEWFFVGTHYNTNGGGYFKDIFENNFSDIVEEYYGLNQYLLNTYVEKALDNGMAISLGERNAFGPHAITLWGVHYDNEGYVDGIFVSDSGTKPGNNAPNKEETGLLYMNIEYDEYGKVYATNVYNAKVPLTRITIFSDGKEQWKRYFDTHEPLKK